MPARKASLFGKYREIVIAVAFFLLFDLGVLILNFYTSFQINEDAVAINLAGRQRMLSQRMTKAVLDLQSLRAEGAPAEAARVELTRTRALFDRTLKAFASGGETAGGTGQPVTLRAVESERGREVLAAATSLWTRYQKATAPLVAESFTDADLDAAVLATRDLNLGLLDAMNDLTGALEAGAADRAEWLRRVQAGGMLLALLNFGFILFKFLRRLRDNDARIEQAQQENREILDTVSEGLLLLAPDHRVGTQFSASLGGILGCEVRSGDNFLDLLATMVAPATHEAAREYLALLFGDRVKETLVRSLNPLSEVPVTLEGQGGARRYLDFEFRRAMVAGKVSHLLVTVADVTGQVELAQELDEARKRAASEVGVLLNLLRAEPRALAGYLDDTQARLEQINDDLRERVGEDDPRRLIQGFCRVLHGIKGEAAALGLDMFETMAHEFERLLLPLRDAPRLDADALLSIPVRLSAFLERIALVREMTARIQQMHPRDAAPAETVAPVTPLDVASQLERVARNVADDQNKWLNLAIDLDSLAPLPAPLRGELRDITVQLVRNAVSHGIETPDERRARAKPATGLIEVKARALPDCYELVVRDDGRGMSPAAVRAALLASGRYGEAELAALDDREVLMKVFEAGVSTAADRADGHAGHGIGMDLVRDRLARLGAGLRCSTRENEFTQFTVRLAN
ncbi:type IV pili methyl-accepting chemotaxis transducer N-terminal domain-containing protein [Derxia gummosa]|uniref:Type IV pili methyl-accepting chemotaxis transducer N-terminal domain-containing protein n=1 Tax=Derxia gummosa DSM 723 TaxID=1121388 RepID=A0A8B6X836_9BURK|nr:type IV pili methyl-accepting chemotaxis transducer N-terminal domain-containing protein [Derxia gummosa]